MKCTIDVETTGKDHRVYDIIQICIVPVNHKYEPIEEDAFYYQIKSDFPEKADPEALKVNGLNPRKGLSKHDVIKLFKRWIDKVKHKYSFDKIVPIGQYYSFDMEFIIDLLGFEYYYEIFSRSYIDTKSNAAFIKDTIDPSFETSLKWQATHFNISNLDHHDAFNDCRVTTFIYKNQRILLQKQNSKSESCVFCNCNHYEGKSTNRLVCECGHDELSHQQN